jgi:hypothetical protein
LVPLGRLFGWAATACCVTGREESREPLSGDTAGSDTGKVASEAARTEKGSEAKEESVFIKSPTANNVRVTRALILYSLGIQSIRNQ